MGIALSEEVSTVILLLLNGEKSLTGICSVCSGTVVQYEDTGEIVTDGAQVLRVGAQVGGTVLSVEASLQYAATRV